MKHNSSDLRFCSCRMCRYGRRSKRGSWIVTKVRRSARRRVKQLIKQWRFDEIPERIGVPYTD